MAQHLEFESDGAPIKAWVRDVPIDDGALQQLRNVAKLPFIHRWVAAMPDVHWGIGATVGSVIPTHKAIIPAAVGVDIGCGMMALRTTLDASDLPDDLKGLRNDIERAVPHGAGGRGKRDKGSWQNPPAAAEEVWKTMRGGYEHLIERFPTLNRGKHIQQLGTLGGGNHFIELCLDEAERVWVMLHSGSRGVGNRIGSFFIERAKKEMEDMIGNLPDKNLAYFNEGSQEFEDYVFAVDWAQNYARSNRELMMKAVLEALQKSGDLPGFRADEMAVNCHHNYVQREEHFGESVFVTRKGAVSAREGELGIIPGSMGARSFIVRGKDNPNSFHSCSHGAGRVMSRTQAKKQYSIDDHIEATKGVECRKDAGVIDETPMAYKPIEKVMAAQSDLVDIVHTLKQVVCVKG